MVVSVVAWRSFDSIGLVSLCSMPDGRSPKCGSEERFKCVASQTIS